MEVIITKTDKGFYGTFAVSKVDRPYEHREIIHIAGIAKVRDDGTKLIAVRTCLLMGSTRKEMYDTLGRIVMSVLKLNASYKTYWESFQQSEIVTIDTSQEELE